MACRCQNDLSTTASAVLFILGELYLGVRLGCLDVRALTKRLTGTARQEASSEILTISIKCAAELGSLWEEMKPQFEQMKLDRLF